MPNGSSKFVKSFGHRRVDCRGYHVARSHLVEAVDRMPVGVVPVVGGNSRRRHWAEHKHHWVVVGSKGCPVGVRRTQLEEHVHTVSKHAVAGSGPVAAGIVALGRGSLVVAATTPVALDPLGCPVAGDTVADAVAVDRGLVGRAHHRRQVVRTARHPRL